MAELKSKIRTEIREGLGTISIALKLFSNLALVALTGDPKATMQYDRYEKLIVIDKGVQLINWPDDIPFVNASNIGSLHTLHHLIAALTDDDDEKRCRWVHLAADELEARTKTYYDKDIPRRRKWKVDLTNDDNDSAGETTEDNEENTNEARPTKKPQTSESSKEADVSYGKKDLSRGRAKGTTKNSKGAMKGKGTTTGKVGKNKAKRVNQGDGDKENNLERSGNKDSQRKVSAHNGSTLLALHN